MKMNKIWEPWFCEETNSEDDAENVNIKKFRGDLAYQRQEFEKALCEYSGCLKLLPSSNLAMRRDVLESQARCLSCLGRHKEALEVAETLRSKATNTDQIAAILCLQLAIYRSLEHTESIIGCLQQLITLHPFHPRHWKLLAEAYMSLLQSPSTAEADFLQSDSSADASLPFTPERDGRCASCEESQTVQGPMTALGKSEAQHAMKKTLCSSMGQEGSQNIGIYSCAAFIRARLLFQLLQSNQSSFALERNLKAQQEIEDKVASFGLKEDVLSLITEVSEAEMFDFWNK
uniref:Chromosome 8 open reading frame 76 n=1 Tax=Anolis carolinensis TaxID=28377 RepID=H9GFC9_ANOCA